MAVGSRSLDPSTCPVGPFVRVLARDPATQLPPCSRPDGLLLRCPCLLGRGLGPPSFACRLSHASLGVGSVPFFPGHNPHAGHTRPAGPVWISRLGSADSRTLLERSLPAADGWGPRSWRPFCVPTSSCPGKRHRSITWNSPGRASAGVPEPLLAWPVRLQARATATGDHSHPGADRRRAAPDAGPELRAGRAQHPLDREANCQATLKHSNRAATVWRSKLPELRKRRCLIPHPPDQN